MKTSPIQSLGLLPCLLLLATVTMLVNVVSSFDDKDAAWQADFMQKNVEQCKRVGGILTGVLTGTWDKNLMRDYMTKCREYHGEAGITDEEERCLLLELEDTDTVPKRVSFVMKNKEILIMMFAVAQYSIWEQLAGRHFGKNSPLPDAKKIKLAKLMVGDFDALMPSMPSLSWFGIKPTDPEAPDHMDPEIEPPELEEPCLPNETVDITIYIVIHRPKGTVRKLKPFVEVEIPPTEHPNESLFVVHTRPNGTRTKMIRVRKVRTPPENHWFSSTPKVDHSIPKVASTDVVDWSGGDDDDVPAAKSPAAPGKDVKKPPPKDKVKPNEPKAQPPPTGSFSVRTVEVDGRDGGYG